MIKQVVAVGFVAFLVYWILNFAAWLDLTRRTYDHAPGPCRRLEGIEFGSEDIQALPDGHAFISSGVHVKETPAYSSRPGRIYLFNFNKPKVAPQELTIKAPDNIKLISPIGLSLWTDSKTGNVYLYVISHQKYETVDKFQFDASTKTLTHLRRIDNDPNFHHMDDLLVVGEDQFFYTNFIYFNDVAELLLGLRWGSLGYFDGTRSMLLDTGLYIPNGVMLSLDGRFLYLANMAGKDIRIYRRYENNSVTFMNSINIGSLVDNLDIDPKTGDLWVAAHPVTYKGLQLLGKPTSISPSQVLRLKLSPDGQPTKIEEIYSNDGTELSGSSVAVRHGRGLLIGTATQHALYCEFK
jgi:sugar lactone lactonase YvrE